MKIREGTILTAIRSRSVAMVFSVEERSKDGNGKWHENIPIYEMTRYHMRKSGISRDHVKGVIGRNLQKFESRLK